MLLFIKDIPKYVSQKELKRSIARARGGLGMIFPFIKGFTLVKCEILRLEDRGKKTIEYHGLIGIEPEKICHSLIRRLNGTILFGKRVEVRPYIKRSVYKDRRRLHADLELLPQERRKRDRRRSLLYSRSFQCRKSNS
jgi:hypothetical protein